MAGLVGSSNNPISGVTIATVIVSALILVQLMGKTGVAAVLGPIAVIYLAGLICSAAAIAGDNIVIDQGVVSWGDTATGSIDVTNDGGVAVDILDNKAHQTEDARDAELLPVIMPNVTPKDLELMNDEDIAAILNV